MSPAPAAGKPPEVNAIRAFGLIPARIRSTRIPEKPLQDLGGQPLVVRVLERVRSASSLKAVWVATDDDRVLDAVRAAGGAAVRTRADHATGLDRVAEAARLLAEPEALVPSDVIVNLQGDEPFLDPAGVDQLVGLFGREEVSMATLAAPFEAAAAVLDPNRVKVVLDGAGRALYFSRLPIPSGADPGAPALLHLGVYGYRWDTLQTLAALPQTPLERAEGLEQLRALWHGIPIHVLVGAFAAHGIDTWDDLAEARKRWRQGRSTG